MATTPRSIAAAVIKAHQTQTRNTSTLAIPAQPNLTTPYADWAAGRTPTNAHTITPLPRDLATFLAGTFGPMLPTVPTPINQPQDGAERPEPRRFQPPIAWNLPHGIPGSEGLKLAGFAHLRVIAEVYSVARACINVRKEEILGLDWDIVPTPDAEKKMRGDKEARREFEERRAPILKFWRKPDPRKYPSFSAWLGALIEEILVTDALSLYLWPSRLPGKGVAGSDLGTLFHVDGSTVRPYLDIHGDVPAPPNPAYAQYLFGVPRSDRMTMLTGEDVKELGESKVKDYRGDQMLYLPYTPRVWTPYGFPSTEMALVAIMSGLQRQAYQREYFDESNVPAVFLGTGNPASTPAECKQLQDILNAQATDPGFKHKILVVPGDAKVSPMRPNPLADAFDELVMTQVCCVPGTQVVTRKGLVAIEDIKVGDLVLTHRGRWRTVSATMKNPTYNEIRCIRANGLSPLNVTGNHPVWAARYSQTSTHRQCYEETNWVPARDVRAKRTRGAFDALTLPIPEMGNTDARLRIMDHISGRGRYSVHEYEGYVVHVHPRVQPLPAQISMDAALGRLLGFYMAEGSMGNSQIFWYFHQDEVAYQQQVIDDLAAVFGLPAKLKPAVGKCTAVVCQSALLAELFSCGTARTKKLPTWAWDGSPEFYASLLWGWIAGDGTLTHSGWKGYTSSPDLAWQMRLVALACGHEPQMRAQTQPPSSIRGRELNRGGEPIYAVEVVLRQQRRGTYRIDGPHLTSPVRSNEQLTYDGPVYNLEVDEDQSYVTTGGTVHNCMMYDVQPMEIGIQPRASTTGPTGGAMNQMSKASDEINKRKALKPLLKWLKDNIFDPVTQDVIGATDMMFHWEGLGGDDDQQASVETLLSKVKNGLLSIDEGRIAQGDQPWGLEITSKPVYFTATGIVPIDEADPATQAAAKAEALGLPPGMAPPGEGMGGPPKPKGPRGPNGKGTGGKKRARGGTPAHAAGSAGAAAAARIGGGAHTGKPTGDQGQAGQTKTATATLTKDVDHNPDWYDHNWVLTPAGLAAMRGILDDPQASEDDKRRARTAIADEDVDDLGEYEPLKPFATGDVSSREFSGNSYRSAVFDDPDGEMITGRPGRVVVLGESDGEEVDVDNYLIAFHADDIPQVADGLDRMAQRASVAPPAVPEGNEGPILLAKDTVANRHVAAFYDVDGDLYGEFVGFVAVALEPGGTEEWDQLGLGGEIETYSAKDAPLIAAELRRLAGASSVKFSTATLTKAPPVPLHAALRELDLIRRRLNKGVGLNGWRAEHIPPVVFTALHADLATLTPTDAITKARTAVRDLAARQRRDQALAPTARMVAHGLHDLTMAVVAGRLSTPGFVDAGVALLRRGIRVGLEAGAAHARADRGTPLAQAEALTKAAVGEPDWVDSLDNRFGLYAGTVFSAYATGQGLFTVGDSDDPDNIVIRWHAKPGACILCAPRDGMLFTTGALPGMPGDGGFGKVDKATGQILGDNVICMGGVNCRCHLSRVLVTPEQVAAARPALPAGPTTTPPAADGLDIVTTPTQTGAELLRAADAVRTALALPERQQAVALGRVWDTLAEQRAEAQREYLVRLLYDVLTAANLVGEVITETTEVGLPGLGSAAAGAAGMGAVIGGQPPPVEPVTKARKKARDLVPGLQWYHGWIPRGLTQGTDLIAAGHADEVAHEAYRAALKYPNPRSELAGRLLYHGGGVGPHGDEALHSIAVRQGFDGPAQVVSPKDLTRSTRRGVRAMFRGVRPTSDGKMTAVQVHEQLRTGDAFWGLGFSGNGIYLSSSESEAGRYGLVRRYALHRDARVIDFRDLQREQQEFLEQMEGESNWRLPSGITARVFSDPGRYAAARGYDAIRWRRGEEVGRRPLEEDEFIVLNRTALLAEEM